MRMIITTVWCCYEGQVDKYVKSLAQNQSQSRYSIIVCFLQSNPHFQPESCPNDSDSFIDPPISLSVHPPSINCTWNWDNKREKSFGCSKLVCWTGCWAIQTDIPPTPHTGEPKVNTFQLNQTILPPTTLSLSDQ
jgi:hypothetical protein